MVLETLYFPKMFDKMIGDGCHLYPKVKMGVERNWTHLSQYIVEEIIL